MNRPSVLRPVSAEDHPRWWVALPLMLFALGMVLLFIHDRMDRGPSAASEIPSPKSLNVNLTHSTRIDVASPAISINRSVVSKTIAVNPRMSATQSASFGDSSRVPATPSVQAASVIYAPTERPNAELRIVPRSSGVEITGRITLEGTPPREMRLPLASDPQCRQYARNDATTRFYVVDSEGGLADTFVHIKEGLDNRFIPEPAEAVVVDQRECNFHPYVFGLQTDQLLLIKNSDPALHGIHVTPSLTSGNKESMRAIMAGAEPAAYIFEHPEIFLRIKSDVHPWMFAYAAVVHHPYFAVSGSDGRFTIHNVPPGDYLVEAVHRKTHPRGKGIAKAVSVGPDGAVIDFTIRLNEEE